MHESEKSALKADASLTHDLHFTSYIVNEVDATKSSSKVFIKILNGSSYTVQKSLIRSRNGSRNEGGGATSSEAAPGYFGKKWHLAYCYKEDQWILKYLA